jgi:hypothetical protein
MHSSFFIQPPPAEVLADAGYVEDTGPPTLALNAVEHVAQWLSHNAAAACRFAAAPVDLLVDMLDDINCEDSARLIE